MVVSLEEGREIFLNVPKEIQTLTYLLGALLFIVILVRLVLIYREIERGRGTGIIRRILENKRSFLRNTLCLVLAQRRVLRDKIGGVMHLLIFLPIVIILLVDLVESCLHFTGREIRGLGYVLLSSVYDLLGLLVVIGLIIALIRRLSGKWIWIGKTREDLPIIILGLIVLLTGFWVEACRISYTGVREPYSFIGNFIANFLTSNEKTHYYVWITHSISAFFLILAIPFTKLIHLVLAPFNLGLKGDGTELEINKIENIEEQELIGISKGDEMDKLQILSVYTCVSCGRCREICPTFNTGKTLSPMELVQRTKEEMWNSLQLEEVWQCTTCGYCSKACPLRVDPLSLVIERRRYNTLMEGKIAQSLAESIRNVMNTGNPWGLSREKRNELKRERKGAKILYWVGCSSYYDERNRKIAEAVMSLLDLAGVEYEVLGEGESCCGDWIRRAGDEYLFQVLAKENIEKLNEYELVIVHCPHGYNALKEYKELGGKFEVVHHTSYLLSLIEEGKLKPKELNLEVVYHDPCYLGRYNEIYSEPREILSKISRLKEAKRKMESSFCCGGGGAQMFLEEREGERINLMRYRELKEESENLAVACPFCLTMLSDASKIEGEEESVKIMDVSEYLLEAVKEE